MNGSWWVSVSIIVLVIIVAFVIYRWWKHSEKIPKDHPKK
jgi:hypothetical protein